MTLRHLRIFVTVCDTGGVTAAARALYMAQPSVSLALQELEGYYGVPFFDRIARRLHLTQAGERFLTYARHILTLYEEMERSVRNLDGAGFLRVGASSTCGSCLMPQLAQAFARQFPQVELRVTVDNSNSLQQRVMENRLDLALVEGVSPWDKLETIPFLTDELVVLCPADDPAAEKGVITLEQLSQARLLLREEGSGTRELIDSVMRVEGCTLHPVWESISTGAILSAVRAGLGLTILPERLAREEVRQGRVRRLAVEGVRFPRNLSVVYHEHKFLSPSAQYLIGLCQKLGQQEL